MLELSEAWRGSTTAGCDILTASLRHLAYNYLSIKYLRKYSFVDSEVSCIGRGLAREVALDCPTVQFNLFGQLLGCEMAFIAQAVDLRCNRVDRLRWDWRGSG
jgi:hypothetical protein